MKIRLSILMLLFIESGVYSQTLSVINYATKEPVSGIHVFNINETLTAITDVNGKADISKFKEDDLLVFSHTSYSQILLKKKDLTSTNYVVELHPITLNLDEFIFSANKRVQAKEEVPNKITSITSQDVKLSDPQTSADLIAATGKVFVQKSQLGGGSPMIRGFSANKVLIVVDGVRMNNAIFRGGNLQNIISIDPNYLEKSEIVFGPGSVIYGSDALGGVMDFQTISPIFSDSSIQTNGNASVRTSSANKEITSHVDFRIGGKKWSSVSSITYSQFDNLKMGNYGPDEYLRLDYVETTNGVDNMVKNQNPRTQVNSGFRSYSVLQKLGYKFNRNVNLSYSFLYSSTSIVPRYDRLIQRTDAQTLKYAEWHYGPQNWMMNKLDLNINSPNTLFDNMHVTVAFQNFKESRIDRKFGSNMKRNKTENVNMLSANIDFDNAISGRTTMYYGFESVYNKVGSVANSIENGVEKPIITRYPDGSKYWSNAGYLNFQMNHSPKTTLVFGVRYSHINIDAQLDTTFYKLTELATINQSTGALTGSVGIAHRPNTSWQMNLNLSSGFKAPNIDDIAKVFDSQPGNVVVPNPNLKPEFLYSIDGLLEKKLGAKKNVSVQLSGFYSYLVDAMVQRPVKYNGIDSIYYEGELSQIESIVNTGNAYITGVSVGFKAKVNSHWLINGTMTYTYGKDNEGYNLRHVSPLFSSSHVIYTYKKLRVDGYVTYNGQLANSRMAPTELSKPHLYILDGNGDLYSPSWYTLNLKTSLSLTDKWMINVGLENITDQRYRAYSSGISGPGMNWIGAVKFSF